MKVEEILKNLKLSSIWDRSREIEEFEEKYSMSISGNIECNGQLLFQIINELYSYDVVNPYSPFDSSLFNNAYKLT